MMRGRLVAAAIVLGLATSAVAQISSVPSGPPGSPPVGGPPPGGFPGGPPGGPGGPPPGGGPGPNGLLGGPGAGPPPEQLTEAQQLAASLPPPEPGGMMPVPPLAEDAPLPGPSPRDFQGTWYHNQNLQFRNERDMYGKRLPYNMAGAKVMQRRALSLKSGTPFMNASSICRPPGQQWQHDLNMPFSIFQSKDWIEFVFEEYHGRWHVLTNPAATPAAKSGAPKDYMGTSVGHWDGDTLVVETTGFRQSLWLDVDGTPMSATGRMTHRIRKVESATRDPMLEVITTIDDPVYYTKPWSMVRTWGWQPIYAVFNEYNCEEQVGDPVVHADAGLVPEPND